MSKMCCSCVINWFGFSHNLPNDLSLLISYAAEMTSGEGGVEREREKTCGGKIDNADKYLSHVFFPLSDAATLCVLSGRSPVLRVRCAIV